jgi:hypothetical protein
MSFSTYLRKALAQLDFARRNQPGYTFIELTRAIEARSAAIQQQRQSSPMSASPIHDWLAAIYAGDGAPDQATRDRFHGAIATITKGYPEAPEHIGISLVACKLEMEDRGGRVSLLSLAESAAALLTDAAEGKLQTELPESYAEHLTAALLLEVASPYERVTGGQNEYGGSVWMESRYAKAETNASMTNKCPKCQRDLPDPGVLECPFCGIIFSRFKRGSFSDATSSDPGRLMKWKGLLRETDFSMAARVLYSRFTGSMIPKRLADLLTTFMQQPDFANAVALLQFDPQLLAVFESCKSKAYLRVRDLMLSQPIANIFPEPDLSDLEVRAVLVESFIEGQAVTLVAVADDTVSLYLSGGGGALGLGNHAQVREASRVVLRKADSIKHRMSPGDGHSPPAAGCIIFVLRTPQGNLSAEVLESEFTKGSHPLFPLLEPTNDLLSAIGRAPAPN